MMFLMAVQCELFPGIRQCHLGSGESVGLLLQRTNQKLNETTKQMGIIWFVVLRRKSFPGKLLKYIFNYCYN